MWVFLIFLISTQLSMSADTGTNCTSLRDSFANATSDFMNCAICNSRPITLCGNCVDSYIDIIESYGKLIQFLDENKTHCIDKFINLDRLQIIETLYSSSYNLWNDAKCYECYQIVNGTLTPNKSVAAITFNEYFSKYKDCTSQKGVNKTNVCTMCYDDYVRLDNYYHSISNENEKIGVCMDMVDQMNTTRSYWSTQCCKYRKHNEYIFIISTTTVLIVTLCFYITVNFFAVKKTPTVLQQRRFAESFNQIQFPDEQ